MNLSKIFYGLLTNDSLPKLIYPDLNKQIIPANKLTRAFDSHGLKIVKIQFINQMRISLKTCIGTSLFSIWFKDSWIKNSKTLIGLIKIILIIYSFSHYTIHVHEFVWMTAHFLCKDYIFSDDEWHFGRKSAFIFR